MILKCVAVGLSCPRPPTANHPRDHAPISARPSYAVLHTCRGYQRRAARDFFFLVSVRLVCLVLQQCLTVFFVLNSVLVVGTTVRCHHTNVWRNVRHHAHNACACAICHGLRMRLDTPDGYWLEKYLENKMNLCKIFSLSRSIKQCHCLCLFIVGLISTLGLAKDSKESWHWSKRHPVPDLFMLTNYSKNIIRSKEFIVYIFLRTKQCRARLALQSMISVQVS